VRLAATDVDVALSDPSMQSSQHAPVGSAEAPTDCAAEGNLMQSADACAVLSTLREDGLDRAASTSQRTAPAAMLDGAVSTAGAVADDAEQLPSVNAVRKAALVLETQQELPDDRRLLLERLILR
jgi:hypothetical protein